MSFICAKCGPISSGERQYLIATKIRNVDYNLQVKTIFADKTVVKTIRKSSGKEIAEESRFCAKHIPKQDEFKIVGSAVRNQIVKTILRIKTGAKEEDE